MIFIDGSNLLWATWRYRELTNQTDYEIDLIKLRDELISMKQDHEFVRAYYYGSEDKSSRKYKAQQSFFNKLRYEGFVVITKPIRVYRESDGTTKKKEKGVDVALATDLVYYGLKENYHTAIIVSGDSDLAGAIQKTKEYNAYLKFEIAQFKSAIGHELLQVADKLIYLDDVAEKIKK